MSAPATPVVRPDVATKGKAARGEARPKKERFGGLVEFWLRFHTVLIYLFLYIPITVVVIFSFNGTDRRVTNWQNSGNPSR